MIVHPIWFYLAEVSDVIKHISIIGVIIMTVISAAWCFVFLSDYDKDTINDILKKTKKLIYVFLMLLFGAIIFPTKGTCIKMIIVSQISDENIDKVDEKAKEIIDYIVNKAKEVEDANNSK